MSPVKGWHYPLEVSELIGPIHPCQIGDRSLMVVARRDGFEVFDAVCPHRGASLAHGGELVDDDHVRCLFHGHHIALGQRDECFSVRRHATLHAGGVVFVLVDGGDDRGFAAYFRRLTSTHRLIPAFALDLPVSAPYVIENVFDAAHFASLHEVAAAPTLAVEDTPAGGLVVTGSFATEELNPWQRATVGDGDDLVRSHFRANVFSPYLVASEIGDADSPAVVFTGATPRPDGCRVHVAVAVPPLSDGSPPTVGAVAPLIRDSRIAFEQDRLVWAHLDESAPQRFTAGDAAVVRFREFCDGFR